MVQNLAPSTRYEFVVRLHVDQMSSPWSSVVYHQTRAAGNKLETKFLSQHLLTHTRMSLLDLFAISAPNHQPAGVRVTLIEEDTALVSWREPSEPNEVITHYTILYASQTAWMDGKWQRIQREG